MRSPHKNALNRARATVTLDGIVYSDDTAGTLRLYVYNSTGTGYLVRQYFAKKLRYPDEEVLVPLAKRMADDAVEHGLEVRITNCSDFCIYHWRGGRLLYPEDAAEFWRRIG